jgi:hypothetical protein
MCVPGGPKILLDSEPRAPVPPTAPAPARPPRRGPRSGWRRASLHRSYLTVKNNPRPTSSGGWEVDSLESASSWIIRDSSWHESCHIRMKGVDQ